jgi:hypothetical protein
MVVRFKEIKGLYECMTQMAVIDTISKGKKQCHHCSRNWRVCWKSSIMLLACALGRKRHIKNLVKEQKNCAAVNSLQQLMSGARFTAALE